MIKSFKHKGLANFFEIGSTVGIQCAHEKKLRLILGRLNAAIKPQDMSLPGLKLHKLSGLRRDTWSVWVNGNWRITFDFENGHAKHVTHVNYEDYH